MRPGKYLLSAAVCMIIATASGTASATLGESVGSIASDQKAMSALSGSSTVRQGYTVQEVKSESTAVREFVSPSGIVFGIAWNGLVHPDLSQLLGTYFPEYDKAVKQKRRVPGRRSSRIRTDRLVVETWGHMRNLQGRAYDPSLIPTGVSIDDIK